MSQHTIHQSSVLQHNNCYLVISVHTELFWEKDNLYDQNDHLKCACKMTLKWFIEVGFDNKSSFFKVIHKFLDL